MADDQQPQPQGAGGGEADPPNVRGPRDRARTEAERLHRLDHPRAASRGVPFRVSRTQRRDQQTELRLDLRLRCAAASAARQGKP